MSAKSATEQRLSQLLIERWEQVSRNFAELTEELPLETFEWAPVPGLRNCGDVLRHVAFCNQYITASLRGRDANDSANELAAADCPTKNKALAVLRSSAAEVAAALREHRGDLPPKTMELVVTSSSTTASWPSMAD
jgi:hypothetical protein